MSRDKVVILDPGRFEQRTSSSGRTRSLIRVTSEPIAINLDTKALGDGIAVALAEHYRRQVQAIGATAAPATIKYRKTMAWEVAAGKAWALARYSGGRMRLLPPNQSDRAFNDSGRFARSIVAKAAKDGTWVVNVAANRLNDATSGGALRIWRKLLEYVPAFGNVALALQSNDVLAAAIKSTAALVAKSAPTSRPPNLAAISGAFDKLTQLLTVDDDEPEQKETA